MNMKIDTPLSLFWSLVTMVTLTIGMPTLGFGQIGDDEEEPKPILIEEKQLNQLLMWMVDEKYEKVLFKAIRYIENDKTSRHPSRPRAIRRTVFYYPRAERSYILTPNLEIFYKPSSRSYPANIFIILRQKALIL